MRLNESIIITNSDQGAIALNESNGDYLRLNSTASILIHTLRLNGRASQITVNDIADVLIAKWEITSEAAINEAKRISVMFQESGILID